MKYGRPIRVATRSSALSLVQAQEAIKALRKTLPEEIFEIITLSPEGDLRKSDSLSAMKRGMFAKRIEQAVMEEEADLAVHSAKDVPSDLPDGLIISGYTKRLDPRDVLVHEGLENLMQLPSGFRIGTSSRRRACQVLNLRPDIKIVPVRGNVDTRLSLPGNGEVDGVILAASGLIRLNRSKDISAFIPVKESIPDVGQGALLIQCRDDDTFPLLKSATDIKTQIAVCAERAFLSAIHGECSSPVAAYAKIFGDEIIVKAMAGTSDGTEIYRTEVKGSVLQPAQVGLNAVQSLLDSGAADLIGPNYD